MRLKPILFFLVVGGFASYVAVRQYQQGDGGVLRIGQIAPDFAIKDSSGKEVKLTDYRGKLVFLNFWASWCGPCEQEMPDLEFLQKTFKDRKFQMLTVSVDVQPEEALKFYKRLNLSMPWFPDPGRSVANKYKVQVYPETFIIDRGGHIIKHYPGPINTQIMAQLDAYIGDQGEGANGSTQ
jgi:peroxiredoxin